MTPARSSFFGLDLEHDATNTMTGTGFGSVTAGGFGGSGDGAWSATVSPESGTISGIAGDGGDVVGIELTFPPCTPAS